MTVAEHHADLHARDPIVLAYKASQYWFEATAIPAVTAAATVLPPPITAAAAGLILGPRPLRALLTDLWHSGPIRRRWTKAVIESGAVDPPKDRSRKRRSYVGPRPSVRVHRTPAGEIFTTDHRTGYVTITDDVCETMAALMRVSAVTVDVDPDNRSRATVTIRRRDAFANQPPFPWPLRDADRTNVWDPLPFAVDEHHQPVEFDTMGGGHILVAGVTGAGKTVALNIIAAQVALDPTADLIIIDGAGGVDYVRWGPCTTALVDENVNAANDVLAQLRQTMITRKADMIYVGVENVNPATLERALYAGADPQTIAKLRKTYHVIIDEAGHFFGGGTENDTDAGKQFSAHVLDLIQRGRKFGIRLVLGIQRPEAGLMSTNVRAQLGYRVGFRTADRETTRMVFPEGDAECHRIGKENHQGVAYMRADGDALRLVRSYYVAPADIDEIARRARRLRGGDVEDEITASGILDPPPEPTAPPENPVPPPVTPRNAQPAMPAPPAAPEPLEQPVAPEKATVTEPAGAFTPDDVTNVHLALQEHRDAWTRANPDQDPNRYPGARREELQRIMVDQRRLSRGWWKAISAGVTDGTIPRTGRPGRGSRKGEGGWRYHPPKETT